MNHVSWPSEALTAVLVPPRMEPSVDVSHEDECQRYARVDESPIVRGKVLRTRDDDWHIDRYIDNVSATGQRPGARYMTHI